MWELELKKKLSKLLGCHVILPDQSESYINLSSHELSQEQKELLNLRVKCHILPKQVQQNKKAEIELLYEQICDLYKAGKIEVNPNIQEQLQAETTKRRGNSKSSLITPSLCKAASELKNSKDIVVRRADKASVFVILDKSDYPSETREILEDTAKFKRITRNPTEHLKKSLNQLITAANSVVGGVQFARS